MADNTRQYGFRWSYNVNGKPQPQPIECAVASAANFAVSGIGTNLNLNVGDPVKYATDGTVNLCGGNENSQTSQTGFGVVIGFGPYFNGTRMVRERFLPSGVTYGTSVDRQSTVLVVPFSAGYWEIDCDDATTATSYLAYQALVGENCDHRLAPNGSGFVTAQLFANPVLNIASHAAATTTLSMRIQGVSKNLSNADFTGNYVKMIVGINKGAEAFYTNVGT